MRVLLDGAGDDLVVQLAHDAVQSGAEAAPKRDVLERRERPLRAHDVRGAQGHVRRAQHVQLEPLQPARQLALSVARIDNDPAENEDRVLGVDAREAVVAGLVEEEILHRPTLRRDEKPLKRSRTARG